MIYKVSQQDLSSIKLNESDTVASVLQNVAIILSTRRQSVPLHRAFGLSQHFVDKPIPVAKPMMISEIQEALLEFEPRATLVAVKFTEDAAVPGKLIPTVEVEINEQ